MGLHGQCISKKYVYIYFLGKKDLPYNPEDLSIVEAIHITNTHN